MIFIATRTINSMISRYLLISMEAGFRSLAEAVDTTTAPGPMIMQMVGAFAELQESFRKELN
jgi:DNA invertase Pin-like site-specific DNA recombinase